MKSALAFLNPFLEDDLMIESLVLRISVVFFLFAAAPSAVTAHPGDGLIIDRHGHLYFGFVHPMVGPQDRHHACLWRLEKTGALRSVVKSKHISSNMMVRLGLDDRIYVAERHYLGERAGKDAFAEELWRLESEGKTTRLLGPTPGRRPYGRGAFAVDETGGIYYAPDVKIMRRDTGGKVSTFAGDRSGHADGQGKSARFERIENMAWGSDRMLYVQDRDRVRIVDPDANVTTLVAGLDRHPTDNGWVKLGGNAGRASSIYFDLTVDPRGDVYIADWGRRRVLRVTKSGKISTLLRPESPWSPEGVAYSDGVLYVLESTVPPARQAKPRVRARKRGGELTTIYEHGN